MWIYQPGLYATTSQHSADMPYLVSAPQKEKFKSGPSCSHLRAQCTGTALLYRPSNCSLLPETSVLHVSVMKAEHFMRNRMHKCLAAKLWLLAESFQESIRLILILFT